MAYNGFLIKTGDYIIPADRYIRSDSYQAGVSLRTVDTYTDANGCEHITQSARLADVTPSVYRISSDTVWYNSVRFTWTGGAYDG